MTLPKLIDIARRVEGSQADGIARAARSWHADDPSYPIHVRNVAGASQVIGPADNHLRGARGLGLDGRRVTDDDLDEMESACRSRGMPCRIDVYHLPHDTVEARLKARGYEVGEVIQTWVFDPAQEPNRDERSSSALDVELVSNDDDDALDAFADLVTQGNSTGPPNNADTLLGRLVVRGSTARCFLARIQGKPVGGGVISVTEGLGAFYFASTLPEHRRNGVQTALMRARLEHAAARGVDFTYVHCSEDSPTRRNGERLGFRYAYTKLSLDRDP